MKSIKCSLPQGTHGSQMCFLMFPVQFSWLLRSGSGTGSNLSAGSKSFRSNDSSLQRFQVGDDVSRILLGHVKPQHGRAGRLSVPGDTLRQEPNPFVF